MVFGGTKLSIIGNKVQSWYQNLLTFWYQVSINGTKTQSWYRSLVTLWYQVSITGTKAHVDAKVYLHFGTIRVILVLVPALMKFGTSFMD